MIWIDCDVIQVDGGIRIVFIIGVFFVMVIVIGKLIKVGMIKINLIIDFFVVIFVGIDKEQGILLDLNYEEDFFVEVDMNVIMIGSGCFVELQGIGEEVIFLREDLNGFFGFVEKGIQELVDK